MTAVRQSSVIFVHSTAHWEALQQQKAQLLGVPPAPEPVVAPVVKKVKKPSSDVKTKRSLAGKEGSRRRQRWTNNNFSEHPQAVLYAEDLRPPGYVHKHHDASIFLQSDSIAVKDDAEKTIVPTILSRHIRHDLKKAHISQGLVTNFESQLIQFIDAWLEDPDDLSKVCLQLGSNNQFERYVLHTMSQYYGFCSFSETNDQNIRITYIFHPAYLDYITKNRVLETEGAAAVVDFKEETESWMMPEKSFFDYLFNKV